MSSKQTWIQRKWTAAVHESAAEWALRQGNPNADWGLCGLCRVIDVGCSQCVVVTELGAHCTVVTLPWENSLDGDVGEILLALAMLHTLIGEME